MAPSYKATRATRVLHTNNTTRTDLVQRGATSEQVAESSLFTCSLLRDPLHLVSHPQPVRSRWCYYCYYLSSHFADCRPGEARFDLADPTVHGRPSITPLMRRVLQARMCRACEGCPQPCRCAAAHVVIDMQSSRCGSRRTVSY